MKSTSLFAACFVAASLLSSCKQDPQSASGPNLPLNSPSTPPSPAITYTASVISHGTTYATLGVEDTDASHRTTLLTASSSSEVYGRPTWNYSGGSIAYSDGATGSIVCAIKAIDVSVNSHGVVAGSNNRTIFSTSTSDSATVATPAWCSISSTGEIAFVRRHLDQAHFNINELCIISQSGGSPTILTQDSGTQMQNGHRITKVSYTNPTWSPDDSKIAIVRRDTNSVPDGTTIESTILIVNASTGARVDSISTTMAISRLEWSRTGTNELAFTASSGSAYELYYVAPSTGSSITGNSVDIGNGPAWSPNNSSILGTEVNVGLIKLIPYSTTQSTVSSNGAGGWLNWKR